MLAGKSLILILQKAAHDSSVEYASVLGAALTVCTVPLLKNFWQTFLSVSYFGVI